MSDGCKRTQKIKEERKYLREGTNVLLLPKLKNIKEQNLQMINAFLESLPVVFFLRDWDYNVIFANQTLKNLVGNTRGKKCHEIWGKPTPCSNCQTFQSQFSKISTPIKNIINHKEKFYEIYHRPIRDIDGSDYMLVTGIDITNHKMTEEKLRISEEKLIKLFNVSPTCISIQTIKDGRFVDVNEFFLKVTGYSRAELIGYTPLDLQIIDEDDFNKIQSMISKQGGLRNLELKYRAKSGEIREVLTSVEITKFGGRHHALVVANDITSLKLMEWEIARLDRLDLIAEMAAGISHEIRNPITTVRGFLQILANKENCYQYHEYFNIMIEELDRANSIISEYLSLSRKTSAEYKTQNLNRIIKILYPLIQADALENHNYVELNLSNNLPHIPLNGKEIRQLILNLARNGLEAMEPGGKLTISTYNNEQKIYLEVRDQGKGIEGEVMNKLGTPFFTTKDNGTGLGLNICQSIASRHNAEISVSTCAEGTTFTVQFKILMAE